MKHNIFKIRKLNQGQVKQPSEAGFNGLNKKTMEIQTNQSQIHDLSNKMTELMSMFGQFMKVSLQNHKTEKPVEKKMEVNQFDVRDRYLNIDLPVTKQTKISPSQIEKWTTDLIVSVFSASFHYYLSEQMTFEQSKVFGSQNILRNILKLTQRFKLTQVQVEIINKHIGEKILDYLQKKYPLTQQNDVNKALQKQVRQRDNLDLLENDFLFSNKIMFTYRQDGNYNDLIMKVLNQAMEQIDASSFFTQFINESKDPQLQNFTNYIDFESYMTELFETVFDIDGVRSSKIDNQKFQKQKSIGKSGHFNQQKQIQRIKEYTNYQIGRKISQNTNLFSQEEINSKNLIIKDSAILRILTKWCQQLWYKFSKQNYFTERIQSIQLQDPQFVNPFFKWMKASIDKRITAQKLNIIAFKKDLDKNIYIQQAFLLLENLQDDSINYIPTLQKASGKFAIQTVKNLYSYITIYLNRLIHGLLKVSKQFHQKQIDKSWSDWPAPPNLLTFKVGDLMRCKIASKEKQILKIFKQIKHINMNSPDKMKIVRIKDRLKQGTNDILINVKFNSLIICEIQLHVVNKTKSKFIQCSNKFSHYIYEIKRSIFGPLSELCNVWHNFEHRSTQYQDMIKMKRKQPTNEKNLCLNSEQHDFVNFNLPFQCKSCQNYYYHNNYFIKNQKCSKCNFYKCARCTINSMEQNQLKKIIFPNKKDALMFKSCKKWQGGQEPPQVGVCVKIESYIIKVEVFKYMKIEGKNWLLGEKNGNIYNIKSIKKKQDIQQFLSDYYIFQIFVSADKFIQISADKGLKFTFKQYFNKTLKEQKEVLILTQIKLKEQQMPQFLKLQPELQKNKRKIKRLQFASNYVKNISFFTGFENLTILNLDYNNIENLVQISKFKHLQKLQISSNQKLKDFSKQFCFLQNLYDIKMNQCQINTLPQEFGNLKSLTQFDFDSNKLTNLPQSFCNILGLEEISCCKNQISILPQNIGNLVSLKKLLLKQNKLSTVPLNFSNLVNLITLDLSNNLIEQLPDVFHGFSKLQNLKLANNKLKEIPSSIGQIESLRNVKLANNLLESLPSFQKCKNLEELQLTTNLLTVLPQSLKNCSKLQNIFVNSNKLQQIPLWFSKLKMKRIEIKSNKLKIFPPFIFEMQINVESINLQSNQIEEIPERIMQQQDLINLYLSKNKIKSLPQNIFNLPKLKQLYCRQNQLTKIPSSYNSECKIVKNNTSLKFFTIFQANKIESIDSSLPMLTNHIFINKNCLTSIPLNSLFKQTLQTINLSQNHIKQIPRDIKQYIHIKFINVANNHIQLIPIQLKELTNITFNGLFIQSNPIKIIECIQFCLQKGSSGTKNLVSSMNKNQPKTNSLTPTVSNVPSAIGGDNNDSSSESQAEQ